MSIVSANVNRNHLVHIMYEHTRVRGEKIAYTFLGRSGEIAGTLSYTEINQRAQSIATRLSAKAGDRIIPRFSLRLRFCLCFLGLPLCRLCRCTHSSPPNSGGMDTHVQNPR